MSIFGVVAFILIIKFSRFSLGADIDSISTPLKNLDAEGLVITSMVISHSSLGPWHWAPLSPEGIACMLTFNGILDYKRHVQFNGGGVAALAGKGTAGLKNQHFKDIPCAYRTAWQLADDKFGKDNRTLSMAIACTVGLDREIGPWHFRAPMRAGEVCTMVSEVDVPMTLTLKPSAGTEKKYPNQVKDVSLSFTTKALRQRAAVTSNAGMDHHSRPAPNRFGICTVQTFRSSLSAHFLFMFVQHHLALGFVVIVYDRGGAHKIDLEALLHLSDFYYFPFTIMERLMPGRTATTQKHLDANSYMLYYGTEKSKKKSAQTNSMTVINIADTLAMDRDKSATYDHARMEFASLPGLLFTDADEMLYCPKVSAGSATKPVSVMALRHYVHSSLLQIKQSGMEELRVDTHPYQAQAPDTVSSLKQCLDAGLSRVREAGSGSLVHALFDPRTHREVALVRAMSDMHGCFTNISSLQTWPKSMDLGRRCPFHYNHWSCDGGRMGGRQPNCRCRVAVRTWSNPQLFRKTDRCHLVHYNSHAYTKQEHSRYHGPMLDHEHIGVSPIASMLLASITSSQ